MHFYDIITAENVGAGIPLSEKLKMTNFHIDQLFLRIKNLCAHPNDYYHLINSLKLYAKNSQLQCDISRNKKLDKLKNDKKIHYNKITVHNKTDVTIPDEILDLLS